MSFDTAKIFIDKLFNNEYKNYGFSTEELLGVVFEFIGGEPFLEIKLISKICDYIEKTLIEKKHPWLYFHKFSICSNGILYFKL